MISLSWNCRGLGNARSVRVLGDLVKSRKPDFLFLSETLVDEIVIKKLCSKLGFYSYFSVDCVGQSGGLAVYWKRNVELVISDSSRNHIDVIFLKGGLHQWRLSCYYGFPERERRREAWDFIRLLSTKSSLPWCIVGDFNDMLQGSDKKGLHCHPAYLLNGFRNCIEECNLVELDLVGGKFTWEKSKGSVNWVRERLDRAFATNAWWNLFPLCNLSVHHTITSDHEPIQLDLFNLSHSKRQFRFRFENVWLKEESFKEEVIGYWRSLAPTFLLAKLVDISNFMQKWGRNFFNKFREKIRKQKEVVESYKECTDERGLNKYFEEKDKLHDLLGVEETYWKQRAKAFWLAEGDSNTKFFHAYASKRKKINHVSKLKTEEGEEVYDHERMCSIVEEYFLKLFDSDSLTHSTRLGSTEGLISSTQNERLTEDFTFEEFTEAIKQMHPDKSSGPDGLNPAFFQNFWSTVGVDVFQSCKHWMSEGKFPEGLNDTNVVLIPKKEHAESMKDLRPIALCNVLYKIIAKVLANRIRSILPGIISEHQSAFVPGRSIHDNVLVAFEVLHHMKRKRKGPAGEVALKLDVSKAYDRVNWSFLKARMEQMGFAKKWIEWVMLCVTTVSYSICFNGTSVGPITPKRGLRQGDPLSPYLFLFCVEGLSQLINNAASEGNIQGSKIAEGAPTVTHLLFADDSFLFFQAEVEEAGHVKAILQEYELCSGQAINLQKSGIFFSSNTRMDKQEEIKSVLGVHNDLSGGHYLGLPSFVGKSKKRAFNFIKERLWKRVQGWGEKCLSRGGKSVLLRNVAQTIPTYAMSCFLLPKALSEEMEKIMNKFWWGSGNENRKGIKWLSWANMSMSKLEGGLGFRDLYGFNLALLGKQCWNLLQNPSSLVGRLYKARYYPSKSLFEAVRGGGVSYVWAGLWQAKETFMKGYRWIVGDGRTIRITEDAWLRGKEDYKVTRVTDYRVAGEKVSDFFIPGDRRWDIQKVFSSFQSCDAKLILATPIPKHQVCDRLSWPHATDGKYSVKSGYRFWHLNFSQCRRAVDSKGWGRLWRLEIPHKMKIFMWRLCRNNIPVRYLLRSRGVQTTITCPMCNRDVEHLLHVFMDCHFAKACWEEMGMAFDALSIEEAPAWVLGKLATETSDVAIQIATTLWGIWNARNSKVWDNKFISPAGAMQCSSNQVTQWQQVQKKSRERERGITHEAGTGSKWKAPILDRVKINVDASVLPGAHAYSVGMVLRDSKGQFVRARNSKHAGEVPVFEAEARGVLEALKWIHEMQLVKVDIETDSFLTFQAIDRGIDYNLEVGDLLVECRDLLNDRPDLLVCFVKRQANAVAHLLAKAPCMVDSHNVFMSPPNFLLETLLYDSILIE